MEIPEKLLKFKYHALCAALVLILLAVLQLVPSFVTVLSFFWPLLLSTTLFLAAIVVFGRTSPLGVDVLGRSAGKTGEGSVGSSTAGEERGVLEYVAEQQQGGMFVFDSILGLAGGPSERHVGSPEEHRESVQ